ncbi:copper amine oxidase N-terminal domain-containing protein [Viridibacillus arvi]|uniref:copper amine oxidase N-terminal domain-containing protein n=1 Tax=Viridibacillus arvi TaxID=263475 RepID=UPI0036753C42
MYKKIRLAVMLFFCGTLVDGAMVKADDDHKNKYEDKYEDDEDEYEDEYDDEDYYDEYEDEYDESGDDDEQKTIEKGTWNIWTRNLTRNKEDLPFTNSKTVQLKISTDNAVRDIYVIPKEGEFFVQGKVVSEFLGAKASFYKTSKILEVISKETKLLFRANTNVVYENNVKTPLPAVSFYINEEIYLPLSAIANGLGYVVEWEEKDNMFLCQKLS